MTREKVIAGLECLTHVDFAVYKSECEKRDCPYRNTDCEIAVMVDAYNLLKAQEPMKPNNVPGHWTKVYHCGACGKHIGEVGANKVNLCHHYGQAVKWE